MTIGKRVSLYFKKLPSSLTRLVREPVLFIGVLAISVFLFLFVLLPLFRIFYLSFENNGQFSIQIFQDLMKEAYYRAPFVNSLYLGGWVALISTIIGFAFAYAITRVDLPWKKFFIITSTFPVIAPPFMMSLSMILLFGRQGFVSKVIFAEFLHLPVEFQIYGFWGLLVTEVLTYFSTAYLTLFGVTTSN